MKNNDVKENMTAYEASDFWDEHDFGEFENVQEYRRCSILPKKEKVYWHR